MSVFQSRRAQFLAQMDDNSLAVFPAGSEKIRSNDTEYPFRQNSDFYYLTGFNEPDACLLLINKKGNQQALLFNRKKDKSAEIWHGYRLGQSAAVSELGFDAAYQIEELQKHLPQLLDGLSTLYFPIFQDPALDKMLSNVINELRAGRRKGQTTPSRYIDNLSILHEMRLIKSEEEIVLLSEAAEISAAGHIRAMQECHAGMWEYQLQAELEHEFAQQGARHTAYNSIVAGGENGCILHYTENRGKLRDGDLVLIDAGAEYQGYAGDISRTFPVNGVFSAAQAKLYQLVLDTQISAISQVKPGVALIDINKNAIKQLVDGLLELGILQGEREQLIKDEAYKDFYMHGIGHYLGLDVHDVGDSGTPEHPRLLQAGMVVTIEPGLYISASANVEDRWKKIGIRIEDDVLVTEFGAEVLSADVPKSINEIEALMRSSR
ncbi:Xaa-Pro aminopeptidase [Psychromonas antarctica]|uniref:Xaa-Pro aminopeptidase n=1 Tax=Psychromonas antarctica TaxID=67573 RepID=UPI001EE86CF5|nr:Xaa-Pro aminopeptidase [Psychromonas antarctica]MCG6201017.1 Xaa-Pro aminopeptidase [Psychromonas antarctica]